MCLYNVRLKQPCHEDNSATSTLGRHRASLLAEGKLDFESGRRCNITADLPFARNANLVRALDERIRHRLGLFYQESSFLVSGPLRLLFRCSICGDDLRLASKLHLDNKLGIGLHRSRTNRMQAKAHIASVVSSTLPVHRRLIREVHPRNRFQCYECEYDAQ